MRVYLTNDYHETEVAINVPKDGWISNHQMRRAQKALCGVQGCTCSGPFGYRGPQDQFEEIELCLDSAGKECGRVIFIDFDKEIKAAKTQSKRG